MEARIEDQTQVPVFLMKDLKKLYQEKISNLEVPSDFIDNVHITRLKEEIFKKIPGICEQKNVKLSVLSLDRENGRALFKALKNSITDKGMIISKAAKIIRKPMFENVEIFDGDFSFQKQKASVSKQFVRLISLMLDDNTLSNKPGKCTQNEAINVNFSQLIQFNSVRKKLRSSDNVRRSKTNDPSFLVKIGLLIHSATRMMAFL